MFKCCSLYSGSSGNSFLIKTENTCVLIDSGVSSKKIVSALEDNSIDPGKIDGIFITHEHIDHTRSVGLLSSKYNIPIYANKETWKELLMQNSKLKELNINYFVNDKKFIFQDLEILPFSTPHDAVNPCGFSICKNGKKVSIATDLGHISNKVIKNLESSNLVMLEANYDQDVLKYSRYPYSLKQRIQSPIGHLENSSSGKAISHLIKLGLQNALLIHLSKENNFTELAYKTLVEELNKD